MRGLAEANNADEPVTTLRRAEGDHPAVADAAAWRQDPDVQATEAAMHAFARLLGRAAARKLQSASSPSHRTTEGSTNDD